ncbi:MAG: LapA family protein [Chitinophagales bacterium]|nr:LapA family protein [Chitinophagales bacterium]MDW8427913.1 LapA family protein [Chitinophagales bacterium]
MRLTYVFTVLFLLLALIFAIQNTDVISLRFLFWSFTGSQALIVVLIFVLGYLCGWLLQWPRIWKRNAELRNLKRHRADAADTTGATPS